MNRSVCFFFALIVYAQVLPADVFRPAYLELEHLAENEYAVFWQVPAKGQLRLALYVEFPAGTKRLAEPTAVIQDGSYIERWRIHREGGLVGQTIRIQGLAGGATDVMVRVIRQSGDEQVERLLPQDPVFQVRESEGILEVVRAYTILGFEHILLGADHLLFVLALLLIVNNKKTLILTITAFTIAHSLTLISATLGWLRVPAPPVEAAIALSIVFVAGEVIQQLRGEEGLTAKLPWFVAFSFGLLHGLGFATALSEMGLPADAVPIALLMFNVGVEFGQLAFVFGVLILCWSWRVLHVAWPRWSHYVPAYAIGGMGAFWTIERVLIGFWA